MCGIVGYIGKDPVDVFEILKNGLIGLEYRGYDSAGVAMLGSGNVEVIKCIGAPGNLTVDVSKTATVGIGHTRWATHGGISEENAHPHFGPKGKIAVVHNGTVENFAEINESLRAQGSKLKSTTDTELIAHLIEREYDGTNIKRAVEKGLSQVVGAYGIVVISVEEPERIVAARRGSPLLIGIAKDSLMVASDKNALVEYCQQVVYLDDNEIVEITANGFRVVAKGKEVSKEAHDLEPADIGTGLGSYEHWMLKEIEEQVHTIRAGLAGRVDEEQGKAVLGGVKEILPQLKKVTHVILTGCGTAYHAAQYGKNIMEQLLDVPVRAEIASELLFQKVNEPPETTLVIFVSQSGETADTKEVLQELQQKGFLCLGIVNVAGSSIARIAGVGVYVRAGVERSVASTKAFTSQMLAIFLLTLTMARQQGMSKIEGRQIIEELNKIPERYEEWLKKNKRTVEKLAKKVAKRSALYFLGKKYSFTVALEGALKAKEITYLPTEAYPSGELKHGSLALVDKDYLAFVIIPEENLFPVVSNTIHEIKARGGSVIAITSERLAGNALFKHVDECIRVPFERFNFLAPFYTVLPLQLLSYYAAKELGREIDKPRNLAKSVTVT